MEKIKSSINDIFGLKSFVLKKANEINIYFEKRRVLKEKIRKQLASKIAKEKEKQKLLEKKIKLKNSILEKKRKIKEKKELQKIKDKQKKEKKVARNKLKKEKEKIRLAAEKLKIKEFKAKERKNFLEEKAHLRNKLRKEKLAARLRKENLKEIKREEKGKIQLLRDSLKFVEVRLFVIREKYQLIKQKKRETRFQEAESRKKAREEARKIFEAEKAEEALRQKVVLRLERYSRNMKSIVFQINKRYLTRRRAPLRFIDRIAENGECFIKNEDAVNEEEYLILLFIEGETAKERLRKKISLEDKTDSAETKLFKPKNVFEASDYIIDRLARMFEKERQLKKAS